MFVAMVTMPGSPASATISASCLWYLAFSTECRMPRRLSIRERVSDTSTEMVPTSTGRPWPWISAISSMRALYFSRLVR